MFNPSQPPKSICILRLSAIGDVCNALAVVQAIQKAYPETSITWIIGKIERQLFAHVPNINFVVYDKKAGFKEIFRVWQELKKHKFDVLLNMQTAFRASILSLGISAKTKIGFDPQRSREGQKFFVNQQVQPASDPHVLSGFIQFANAIGVNLKPSQLTWNLYIPAEISHRTQTWLKSNQPSLLIAPCSSKAEKDWTVKNYAEITNLAHAQGKQVILCGTSAPWELAMINNIMQNCDFEPLNLAGKTSLIELASLISQVDLVIAPDSGAGHIANAMGTPVIGLYAYHNPKRTAPFRYVDNVISVYEKFLAQEVDLSKVQPAWAYKLKMPNLMEQITPEMVIAQMRELNFIK